MRILADTSIWINHLRSADTLFQGFLEEGIVLMHPCVHCELALGSLKNRSEILSLLAKLPQTQIATNDEVLQAIEAKKLWGLGIGSVDAQLLAATLLTEACILWTLDTRLRKACEKAGAKLFHHVA
jgi:predicted nucleic acid-binding protein